MKRFWKFVLASALLTGALVGCETNNGTDTPICISHVWNAGEITKPATDTIEGIKTYTCINCGTTKTETIPVTSINCEHEWNDGEITTPATATAEGVKTFTCNKCGTTKTESIPKIVVTEKFKVTYDANGGTGTGPVDMNEYDAGTKVTVKGNTFTAPEGKEFINWNEEPDASGSYHNVNSTFKIYENITLYAQWLDIEVPPVIGGDDDPDTEYNIKVNAPNGVTCVLDKAKAKKDETVTLTLTLSEGTTLNGDPTSRQVALTKTGNNVYTFVMPANAVEINVAVTVQGDVVLTGDISAVLNDPDKDGIYSASVACDTKTSYNFSYVVKDKTGAAKTLSSMNLDETKCDANVTFTSGAHQLLIAGGSTYTFYYDSNLDDYNCYIVRDSVDVLPMNSKTIYNLFDGKLRSQSTIHPQGLTSIHYEKKVNGNDTTLGYKVTDETYDYKKISNTESFAVSLNNRNNEKSYVYKNIDETNNVYSVVNTYLKTSGNQGAVLGNNEADDNIWNLDPYGSLQGERYFPYSARQDIVDNSNYRDTSRYQITEREAYRNISTAAHYGNVLEYEIWNSLRGDFDGTATINAANAEGSHINVESIPANGGFKTTVNSQLEYNHVESGSTADVTQEYAFVYKVIMEFRANGDLAKLDYTEDYYTKDNWNFSKHEPLAGGISIKTTIKVSNGFNESLSGQRSTILGSFRPADYFITSIDKLSFYDSTTKLDKSSSESIMNFDDSLAIYDYLGGGEPSKLVDEFKFSPATALDAWQYGYIDSTDKGVADNTPYGPKTIGVGTAVVTFGNHLNNMNGPTKDVTISVYAGGDFHQLFVNSTIRGYDSFGGGHADYIYGFAGKTMNFYIDSSSNTGCPVSYWMVIKAKDKYGSITYTNTSKYFNVVNSVGEYFDEEDNRSYTKVVGHELILDFNTEESNKLTSNVTIDVIFASNYYKDGWGPSTLHIVVQPAQQSVVGTKWSASYEYADMPGVKYEDAVCEFFSGGTGRITETLYTQVGTVSYVNVYNFSYTEKNNNTFSAAITSVNMQEPDMPKTASSYSLEIERLSDGRVGLCLYTDELDIFGLTSEDEDGYFTVEGLTPFERIVG